MVEEVLPRSSQLAEPAVANVSHVLLVFSAALPGFQPSPATRYLLSAEAAWLPVTVAINKADLVSPEEMQAVVDQVGGWLALWLGGWVGG
jgi:ribosome biogenesis GTPase